MSDRNNKNFKGTSPGYKTSVNKNKPKGSGQGMRAEIPKPENTIKIEAPLTRKSLTFKQKLIRIGIVGSGCK